MSRALSLLLKHIFSQLCQEIPDLLALLWGGAQQLHCISVEAREKLGDKTIRKGRLQLCHTSSTLNVAVRCLLWVNPHGWAAQPHRASVSPSTQQDGDKNRRGQSEKNSGLR